VKPVFVYGTLLAGERNHHRLSTSPLLGEARTGPGFELRNLGDFPGMVRGTGSVVGELYSVSPELLSDLDRFEGSASFVRMRVPLVSGEEVEAYVLPAEKARGKPRIAGGDWRRRGK
jgi:gamma-glutamylaminecyclotransferase